ncbi:alpha/beta hydrolase [Parasphingorhabdus sp.]|uniref:alpha/beta hydrolase n=1 Tax=Parasphingorhabdus sp. TaxID=2709688 RepID=UPI003A93DD6F
MSEENFIRPDVQAYLEQLKAQPRPPFTKEMIAMIRTLPPEVMAEGDLPVGELAVDRGLEMPGPAGTMALRLFDPRASRAAGPVVVFYHGGGFCVGSIGTHAGLAAEIARQLDLPVVSVEYRLAPEAPWPAAPDDAEAAARWIAANAAVFEREFDGLVLCGDSAGGNLAIVTALALRDSPASLPVIQQLLLYPGTDVTRDYPSRAAFSDGYGLDQQDMTLFNQHYGGDPENWRHSPLHAELAGLAPSVLATASLDPLRDEGRAFAAKLVQAGCEVAFSEMRGTIHGFASFRKGIASANDDLAMILNQSQAMLAGKKSDPG